MCVCVGHQGMSRWYVPAESRRIHTALSSPVRVRQAVHSSSLVREGVGDQIDPGSAESELGKMTGMSP